MKPSAAVTKLLTLGKLLRKATAIPFLKRIAYDIIIIMVFLHFKTAFSAVLINEPFFKDLHLHCTER